MSLLNSCKILLRDMALRFFFLFFVMGIETNVYRSWFYSEESWRTQFRMFGQLTRRENSKLIKRRELANRCQHGKNVTIKVVARQVLVYESLVTAWFVTDFPEDMGNGVLIAVIYHKLWRKQEEWSAKKIYNFCLQIYVRRFFRVHHSIFSLWIFCDIKKEIYFISDLI